MVWQLDIAEYQKNWSYQIYWSLKFFSNVFKITLPLGATGVGAAVTAGVCTIGSNSLSKVEEAVFFDLKNFFGLEIASEPGLIIGAFLMEVKEA